MIAASADLKIPADGARAAPVVMSTALVRSALVAGGLAMALVLVVTEQRLDASFLPYFLLAAALAGTAMLGSRRNYPWQVTNLAMIGCFTILGLLICGIVACTGLRLRFPVADALLAQGDAMIGMNVGEVARFVAAVPALSSVLDFVYRTTGPACAAALLWNLVTKNRAHLWQVVATVIVAMQVTAVASIFFPARGSTVFLGLGALHGAGLPPEAGIYAVAAFEHFYAGDELLVGMEQLNGTVTFPSFHTVLALVIVQALAHSPLRWPAVAWGALTIVATVPIGGHYVVDLVGGMLVWIACAWLAGGVSRATNNPDTTLRPTNRAGWRLLRSRA